MQEAVEDSSHFKPTEIQEGLLAAVWQRPVGGFSWRRDVFAEGDKRQHGPWLVAREPVQWERYPILRRQRVLLDEFTALGSNATERRILRFANKYGPLGPGEMLKAKRGHPDTVLRGESIEMWRWHSSAVLTWRELIDRAERGEAARLSPFVVWQREPLGVGIRVAALDGRPTPKLAQMIHVSAAYSSMAPVIPSSAFVDYGMLISEERDPEQILPMLHAGDVIEPIRMYVTMRVNQMLSGHIERTILYPDRSIRYFPDSLQAAIYVRLQDYLTGSDLAESICAYPDCPRIDGRFTPSRRDQRYCSTECRQNAAYHRKKGQEDV